MGLLDAYDIEDKRQMFFASCFLAFVFIVSLLSRLVLWLIAGLCVVACLWLSYDLFARKEERTRLKEAFGTAEKSITRKTKPKRALKAVK